MRHTILVAGVDYGHLPKGVNFRIFCDSRVKRILARNTKKEDLTFQIFDFRRGEVATHEFTYPAGKRVEKTTKLTPSPFKSISRANYDVSSGGEPRFKDGQRDTMSVLDIYRAVQKVGIDAPGTLAELSIFSHGWWAGPILVNSHDDGHINVITPPSTVPAPFPLPPGARDPDDMDPRPTDFTPPTMDAAALSNFQNAFSKDGYIWIWGCAFPRLVHEILHKIEGHPTYKERGLGDDTVFKIKNLNSAQAVYLENGVWRALGGRFPDKRNIEIKFKFLKYFFCQMTEASYSHHLAKNSKVRVYGAVQGTYADYDSGSLPLMHVYTQGFARHFTFYKNYLGFNFDPEGRKYGEYKPGFTCTAPSP
jgi:hypothetical protein